MHASFQSRKVTGFSLIEVALAVAILAVALVALVGLMPSGASNFQTAMDTTVTAQIAQRILHDAEQAEFDDLVDRKHLPPDPAGRSYCPERFSFRAPRVGSPGWRYFDAQGTEVVPKVPDTLSDDERRAAIYCVTTRIRPRAELPTQGESGGQVAQVTVQVARNPAHHELAFDTDEKSPLFNLLKKDTRARVFTFSGLVGRNQGR